MKAINKSFIFVLFGATGDLSRRYIIPALFELFLKGKLVPEWKTILAIRKEWSEDEFAQFIKSALTSSYVEVDDSTILRFISHFSVFVGDIAESSTFDRLYESIEADKKDKRAIFYLAISPSFYKTTMECLMRSNLVDKEDRVLIEKPFGRTSEESRTLNTLADQLYTESQICLVDHYLAKDAIEDIVGTPFKDKPVARVEVCLIEHNTVGKRGAFYDATGAFLDVGQNHLLMMLGTTLSKLSSKPRDTVLKSLNFRGGISCGQYKGYREEPDVKPNSETETYFKALLESDLSPAILSIEAGKGFDRANASVEITYTDGDKELFDFNKSKAESLRPHGKIIMAALDDESSLFVSKCEVMEEWRIADEVLAELCKIPITIYPKGIKYEEISNK